MRRWNDAVVAFAVIPGALAAVNLVLGRAVLGSDRSLLEALDLLRVIRFGLWAAVIVLAAIWAWKRGRARPVLWGLGAGVLAVLWSLVIWFALLAAAGDGDGGCPGGRIYC